MTEAPDLLRPDWQLPAGVHAYYTTRAGGCSLPPYDTFNLGQHAGDDSQSVAANRQHLLARAGQMSGCRALELQWLRQVHGTRVHLAGSGLQWPAPEADGLYGTAPGLALAILTADCLPVLFCSADGREIAAAHAGWRGLLKGVLEATLGCFRAPPGTVSAWLGPAIGRCHFEVGPELRSAFMAVAVPGERAATEAAFLPAAKPGKWFCDLRALARLRLHRCGVSRVEASQACTVCERQHFYSYRAEPITGRFATLIVKSH